MIWEDDFYDNKDVFLPKNLTKPKFGDFGIGLIKFGSGSNVGNWNINGDQCVDSNDFFDKYCNKHQEMHGNKFTYTLVTKTDWDNANRSIEARKQAIERGKKKEEEDRKAAEEAERQRKLKEEEDKKKAEEAAKNKAVSNSDTSSDDTNKLLIEREKTNPYLSIGDSQTHMLSLNTKDKFKTLKSNTSGSTPGDPKFLHKGGWNSSQLISALNSISSYQYPNMKVIAILIGTNDGYNNNTAKQNSKTLKDLLSKIFPNAKLVVVPGSWGWGGLKNIVSYEKGDDSHHSPKSYYDIYQVQGFTILSEKIGGFEPHNPGLESYKKILNELNKY